MCVYLCEYLAQTLKNISHYCLLKTLWAQEIYGSIRFVKPSAALFRPRPLHAFQKMPIHLVRQSLWLPISSHKHTLIHFMNFFGQYTVLTPFSYVLYYVSLGVMAKFESHLGNLHIFYYSMNYECNDLPLSVKFFVIYLFTMFSPCRAPISRQTISLK